MLIAFVPEFPQPDRIHRPPQENERFFCSHHVIRATKSGSLVPNIA